MRYAISLDDLVFQYNAGSRPLQFNLAFPEGMITAVVGVSGSGKSTLLQLINGMVRPDRGRVSVAGEPIDYARLQALRRNIGYMAQGPGLFPHLTIEKNIALASRIRGEVVEQERITQLMEGVGLPASYRQRHPYQLSGGEQQRAAICMALYNRPPILLMDESLGSLDAITRAEIQEQLATLQQRERCTMVLVTHDLYEALRLGDFLLVLHQGRVEAFGTPQEVKSSPSELVQKLFAYSTNIRTQSSGL